MRKIERLMIAAIRNRQDFKLANTEVVVNNNDDNSAVDVLLHGHKIAAFDDKNSLVFFSPRGYKTATTKSRLNAILGEFCGAGIYQSRWVWYAQGPNSAQQFEVERDELYGFAYAN